MMTLEEVWENLRQDPETKATMEEVDKSYKLFKKIENLIVADLEAKLAEKEKLHLFDEKQWQDYCAYKIIEPQIKGCLDRERAYLNFFENFETNVNLIIAHNPRLDKCEIVKEIIYYVDQQIKSLKGDK